MSEKMENKGLCTLRHLRPVSQSRLSSRYVTYEQIIGFVWVKSLGQINGTGLVLFFYTRIVIFSSAPTPTLPLYNSLVCCIQVFSRLLK